MLSHKFILLAIAALAILVVVYVITRVPRTRTQPTASAPAASLPVSDLSKALETHYPDALAEIGQVAPGAELELYTLASDLLFSLSPKVAAAPDGAVVDLLKAHADLIRQLAREDAEACVYAHYYGPQDVESYSPEAKVLTDRLGALTVIAAHQGQLTATARTPPSTAPTLPFDEENPPAPEHVCAHILDLYKQLLALPPAEAANAFIAMKYAP